ncbi:MAG: CinA family protein [Ruminococcaceae bacterium]|nr:CinA family protein [Oscillospiraceae bacterium]
MGMVEEVAELLRSQGKKVALAESCTGGLIAKTLTDIAGSSDFFEYGIVSYSNDVKIKYLGVKKETIDEFTATSKNTAIEMAQGARKNGNADIGIGVTGVAGPGDLNGHPEGEIYIALVDAENVKVTEINTKTQGEREYNREIALKTALEMLKEYLIGR